MTSLCDIRKTILNGWRETEKDENAFSLGPDDFEMLLNAHMEMSTTFEVHIYFRRLLKYGETGLGITS